MPEYPDRCRHIRQNAVGLRQGRVCLRCVIAQGFHVGKAHPFHGGADELYAVLRRVAAVQRAGILHFLGQQQGLAAGRGAQVQHGLTGFCLHTESRQLAGLPLHMVISLPEQFLIRGAALESGQHTAGTTPCRTSRTAEAVTFRTAQRRPL